MHIGIFQCVPTTNFIENKENYLEIYTYIKYHVHFFASLKHLKLPISYKIPVTLLQTVYIYLHESYISKFKVTIYLVANLVFAWL